VLTTLDAIPENSPQEKLGEMIDIAFPDEQIRNEFRTAFGFSTKAQPFENIVMLFGSYLIRRCFNTLYRDCKGST
jgi:hypothetical protein